MAGAVISRGSVVQTTINTIFFKPSIRKAYHSKSSTDTVLVEAVKMEAEDEGNYIYNNKSNEIVKMMNENCNSNCIGWVPHEKTGIYYPKGQEKVMDNVPASSSSSSSGVTTKLDDEDFTVNWFSSI